MNGSEILAAIDLRIDHARRMVATLDPWSPAQAEWSRARDLGMDIRDDVEALLEARKAKP